MSIDSTTILKYFSGSILVIVLLFLFYLYASKNRSWFTISYLISKVLQLFAIIGIILRNTIPNFLSIDLSAVILIAAYSFDVFSIISYDGKFRKLVLILFGISFVFFSFLFILFSYHEAYRSVISSFAAVIIFGIGGIDLLMFRRKLKFPILLGFVLLLYCLTQFYRGILILWKSNVYTLDINSAIDTVFYIVAFIYLTLSSVGFLLLLKEHDEEIMSQKNKALQETTNSKNKLFSIIAHDLKSPIGAMASIGRLLLEQHNQLTPDQREEIINDITKSSVETFNLLNNLLLWTQSETGGLTTRIEEINLNNLARENLQLLKNAIENKRIIVKLELNEKAVVSGDTNMLNTVIRNLLSNAIKFTPIEGTIIITTTQFNNIASIRISDNGIGIESEKLINLFSHVSEHNTNGTNNETGSGLGLKLCKEFIEKNNGEIKIESQLGKGSSFTVSLPYPTF